MGEIITSCYLGAQAACARAVRREHLRDNYLFDCGCPVCSEGRDSFRELPCPHCGTERDASTGLVALKDSGRGSSAGVLSRDVEVRPPSSRSGGASGAHFTKLFSLLSCHSSDSKNLRRLVLKRGSFVGAGDGGSTGCWRCCSCGRSFSDKQIDCPMLRPAPPPLRLSYPSTLFEWEKRCAQRIDNCADMALLHGRADSLEDRRERV